MLQKLTFYFVFTLILFLPKQCFAITDTEILQSFNDYALSQNIYINPNNNLLVLNCTQGSCFTLFYNDFSYSHLDVDLPKRINYILFEFNEKYKVVRSYENLDTGIPFLSGNLILSEYIACLDENKNYHSADHIIIKYKDGSFEIVNNNNYCERYYIPFIGFCNKNVYNGISLHESSILHYNHNADFSVLNSNKIHVLHFIDFSNLFHTFISNFNLYLPFVFVIFVITLIPVIIRFFY